jgi:hypothetical protein
MKFRPIVGDDGPKDDDVALPPSNASPIGGLCLHPAVAKCSSHEVPTDFTTSGATLLQEVRSIDPTTHIKSHMF